MLENELLRAIKYLIIEKEDQKALKDVWEKCSYRPHVYTAIVEVDSLIKTPKGGRFNNKLPFYFLYLAYAHVLIDDLFNAILLTERAIAEFGFNGQKQNQAIGLWILSILYCLYEQIDDARVSRDKSAAIITALLNNRCRSGEYEFQNNIYQYQDIINEIEANYQKLERQLLNGLSSKQIQPTLHINFFIRIIAQLWIPEELEYLESWRVSLINPDWSNFKDDTGILEYLLKRLDEAQKITIESALINILLSHHYNLGYYSNGQLSQEAEIYAQNALASLASDDINRFLAKGYLGLLYYNGNSQGTGRLHLKDTIWNLYKAAAEYDKAVSEPDKGVTEDQRRDYSNSATELIDMQNELHNWIFPFGFTYEVSQATNDASSKHSREVVPAFSARSLRTPLHGVGLKHSAKESSPFAKLLSRKKPQSHDKTPIITDAFDVKQVKLKENKGIEPPKSPPIVPTSNLGRRDNQTNIIHLTLPVDLRALENLDAGVVPSEHDFYEKLETFETHLNDKNGTPSTSSTTKKTSRVIIPSFPIYGSASAGPNGEAQLPNSEGLDRAEAIDETLVVKFDGAKYKTSFIDSSNPTFSQNKTYGWLKIIGESMTNAGIQRNDYVLFRENRNLESCAKRIVIALVSDIDTPRLMVKRLVKMSGDFPCEDGFMPCKYILHSESHLERDPETGLSFRKDIEIENDNQLIGDVVAIAKAIR